MICRCGHHDGLHYNATRRGEKQSLARRRASCTHKDMVTSGAIVVYDENNERIIERVTERRCRNCGLRERVRP